MHEHWPTNDKQTGLILKTHELLYSNALKSYDTKRAKLSVELVGPIWPPLWPHIHKGTA